MKTNNSILLVCIASFFIVSISFTNARGKTPQGAVSIRKKKLDNPIADTGQVRCYNNSRGIPYPQSAKPFFGQDAQYEARSPSYKDNGDGTITDLNTGLMWFKAVDDNKVSLVEAEKIAREMTLGGYSNWRVPNIKELYSLIDFRGYTGFSGRNMSSVPSSAIPFINTDYFDFKYGQVHSGERYIDAQWLSSTKSVSTTMDGNPTLFGVNFADGRIKGYGYKRPGRSREKKFYVRYVRGNEYGINDFVNNGDGTVTDRATGLMWMQKDSGKGMNWQDALEYSENMAYAKYNDWRLPNAKELQHLVDYSRSPAATDSPAIDPIFTTTSIKNEAGVIDYPYFWTSTTHLDGPHPGGNAVYVAFGRAIGKMHDKVMDVHGAGAQRSDPKTGSASFHGPQGDARRSSNFVRCVRGGSVKMRTKTPSEAGSKYPCNAKISGSDDQKKRRASTEPRRNTPGRIGFVERLDGNGDGKVSRSEFDGPEDRFGFHDKNNDGYLTEDEAPKGPPPGGGRPLRR